MNRLMQINIIHSQTLRNLSTFATWSGIFLFIFSACVHSPKLYQESGSFSLRHKIRKIINKSELSTNLGIKVVSLKTKKTLYELNASSLFNPASNNKLFTSISALALLDTGFTFTTSIYRNGNNIYLVGGGDPDFSLARLDSLAKIVAGTMTEIDTLFLDESLMDTIRFGEGWMWDEGPWKYAAQINTIIIYR